MIPPTVLTGLANILSGARPDLRSVKLGLIAHPASVTDDLTASADALLAAGYDISATFGPQHGMRGEKQDNMIESTTFVDPQHGFPVHSLYGDVRKPTAEMLGGLDALLFDLQDVGVRVYTFVWTMTLAMEACREAGVKFVVLDRPNPINGIVREGPTLRPGFESFVGLHPVPLRHGLTTGELAKLANEQFGIGCELDVIACLGWKRTDWFDDTGLPFVLPSPNLPTLDSCVVYPGMVLLEGTNLSEGRGTTRPFEIFGAPYLEPQLLVDRLSSLNLPGVLFRPCYFEPTFQKFAEEICGGAQFHVTDRLVFRPVETAVSILHTVKHLAPEEFQWRPPPYEYEHEKMPIDILWGSEALRTTIDSGRSPDELMRQSGLDLVEFENLVDPYLLYR
ncbi:exo-beta-N-acetylmuramidase NamZ domain-containing protein [Gemmatimonadota bacterium]